MKWKTDNETIYSRKNCIRIKCQCQCNRNKFRQNKSMLLLLLLLLLLWLWLLHLYVYYSFILVHIYSFRNSFILFSLLFHGLAAVNLRTVIAIPSTVFTIQTFCTYVIMAYYFAHKNIFYRLMAFHWQIG